MVIAKRDARKPDRIGISYTPQPVAHGRLDRVFDSQCLAVVEEFGLTIETEE
jgi:hypothetical protein